METTINIDDALLEQLKARAEREGKTVSQLIEDSVRLAAVTQPTNDVAFELVTFGKGGSFSSFDVDHVCSLIEQDDIASRK